MGSLPRDHYTKTLAFTRRTHLDIYPAVNPGRPELSLAGKVAIVTGATRGIGGRVSSNELTHGTCPRPKTNKINLHQGIVPAFVKAGVKGLVLVGTNAEKLSATEQEAKKVNPDIETVLLSMDISDTKAHEMQFSRIRAKFGYADVLVNAAGALVGDGPKLHETDPDEWWRNFVCAHSFSVSW